MRRGRSIDALTYFGQPRDNAAGGEIDVQIHQLPGRGAHSAREAEHLMRQMQAFAVGAEDLRCNAHPLYRVTYCAAARIGTCAFKKLRTRPIVRCLSSSGSFHG